MSSAPTAPSTDVAKGMNGPITGSMEAIYNELSSKVGAYLTMSGETVGPRDTVYVCGTFADSVIVRVQHYLGEGHLSDDDEFYLLSYVVADGKAKFTGEPRKVAVETKTEVLDESGQVIVLKAVVPFTSTPASESPSWDSNVAVAALKKYAAGDGEFDLSKAVQRSKFRKGFAIVRGDGLAVSDYLLPHHDVVDGQLRVNKAAVSAAIGALNGARSDMKISSGDRAGAYKHLKKHLVGDLEVPSDDVPVLKSFDELLDETGVKLEWIGPLSQDDKWLCTFAKRADGDDFTYVFGAVLVPEKADHQGDIVSADVIEKAAHDFMEESQMINVMHAEAIVSRKYCVVESYVAKERTQIGSRKYPAGTWFLGARIYEQSLRKAITDGVIRGWSIEGAARVAAE